MDPAKTPRTLVVCCLDSNWRLLAHPARSFALAGYQNIAVVGESHAVEAIKKHLSEFPQANILAQEADIASPESLGLASHYVRSQLGAWDVFIHMSSPVAVADSEEGQSSTKATIRGSDEDLWWASFERNVRSLHHIARHFFPKMKANATFINVVAGNAEQLAERDSAETASKLAAAKVVEYLAKENQSSGLKALTVNIDPDNAQLDSKLSRSEQISQTLYWCTSEEARFLSGRYVFARDKPKSLLELKKELERDPYKFTIGVRAA